MFTIRIQMQHSFNEDTWSARLLHNIGFSYIHKYVKESLY